MATRQSLRSDPRSSNQGLIGCQSNLIPWSCKASWYDVPGTSIRCERRAPARRHSVGSGHFVYPDVANPPILSYQCFMRRGLCKNIKHYCGFRGLANRLRCWWNSPEIFPFFFCLLNSRDSCRKRRRLRLLWLMSHNFVSVTGKKI